VQDYYAFGMQMPGRKLSGGCRYGFNGKENDNEVKGEGNQQDYGMRMYDGRMGKFLSVDPLTAYYPYYSPYQFAGNNPVKFIDLDGLEPAEPGSKVGERQAGTNGNSDVAKSWEWNGKSWVEASLENVTVAATIKKHIRKQLAQKAEKVILPNI
jgi:RHS repeat-associated protein